MLKNSVCTKERVINFNEGRTPWSEMVILGRCYTSEMLPWRKMMMVVYQGHRRADRAGARIQAARFSK